MIAPIRSLVAVAMAALALAFALLWARHESGRRFALETERQDLRARSAEVADYVTAVARLEARIRGFQQQTEVLRTRMGGSKTDGLQLVKVMVDSVWASGMEMTHIAETSPGNVPNQGASLPSTKRAAYSISLSGSYSNFVAFLRNTSAWEINSKVESINVSANSYDTNADVVDVALVLSVIRREERKTGP